MITAKCVPKVGTEKDVTIEVLREDNVYSIKLRITTFTQYEYADIILDVENADELVEDILAWI